MYRFLIILLLTSIFACKNSTSPKTTETEKQADEWTLGPFVKADDVNPVMQPDSLSAFKCPVRNEMVRWEAKDVFNPAATVRNDTLFLLYRAEDKVGKFAGTSRIGLAWSTDGLHFTKRPAPVFFPENDSLKKYEWEGGCEDPRLVEDEQGMYYLMYTGYDGDKARLMVASSIDLIHWKKHGLAFPPDQYATTWSKSGSVVCTYQNSRFTDEPSALPVATKIHGKYWMYWGDTDIFLATSDDLIHWKPAEDKEGKPVIMFGPRVGKFDSDLVEPGPPAMITDEGILLIYNSRNVPSKGDSSLAEGTYTVSQILFDKVNPAKVIHRMNNYFMKPEKDYEIKGQVGRVCFAEGLVQ